jgi:hypothetical protein
VPPDGPGQPARLITEPVGPVFPDRPGRVPSGLPVGGVPSRLGFSRVPSGFLVYAVELRPAMLPVGSTCAFGPASTIGLARWIG